MDREWTHGAPAAVEVALPGRFYERFADHAVEVGRRVVFQATCSLLTEQGIGTYKAKRPLTGRSDQPVVPVVAVVQHAGAALGGIDEEQERQAE